ncbi:hypothetical protein PRK78_003498 [Emydomyces testavorans]|uniref:Calcineurin-like phosphoesterase domain-containing protein n=1 Tax=Emydomyces testavorans TaxID=2070801 RepID=A0AAF0IIU4_9EURO|nr:hypothetical protein PRK78_003498 [Emydomyces testavorans]
MATSSPNQPRTIKLPGQRLRRFATKLLSLRPLPSSPLLADASSTSPPIKIVCISDTHNCQPELPEGDVLIHAGDLTENGSFEEIQSQLAWLSSQPHRHKIFVAGNHDVLLDEEFLQRYPDRRYGETRTMKDLDWGGVQYLCDSTATLIFSSETEEGNTAAVNSRTTALTIYGTPWTPQYGVSAFQYPRDKDIFSNTLPANADIVVTHGPPRLHLDKRDFHHAGCAYLSRELARVRPRLVVFGHIHVSYGTEDVVLDRIQQEYEDIMNNRAAWGALMWMMFYVFIARVRGLFANRESAVARQRVTTFVNASVVGGGLKNELQNSPIVVEFH